MSEIDLKNYNIRTDLVVDLIDGYVSGSDDEIKEINYGDIKVSDILLGKNNNLNKKSGRYITIFFDDVTDSKNNDKVKKIFMKYFKDMLNSKKLLGKKCLVVGLGNVKSTPDSLGPKVIDNILVTSYLFNNPDILVDDKYSNVSAIVPGVVASTGIETGDIVLGIVEKSKPDFIVVIDALASSSLDRINKTIQIADSGIHPGSGIGNKRKEISYDTIGIPVIAIGVPTVIDGVTIVSDTIKYMLKQFSYNKENFNNNRNKLIPVTSRNYLGHDENLSKEEKEEILGMVGNLSDDEIKKLIFEVLTPVGYNLMVTVKEIDFLIDKLSSLISDGINKCLHSNK